MTYTTLGLHVSAAVRTWLPVCRDDCVCGRLRGAAPLAVMIPFLFTFFAFDGPIPPLD